MRGSIWNPLTVVNCSAASALIKEPLSSARTAVVLLPPVHQHVFGFCKSTFTYCEQLPCLWAKSCSTTSGQMGHAVQCINVFVSTTDGLAGGANSASVCLPWFIVPVRTKFAFWILLFQLCFRYPICLCGQMSAPIVMHVAGSSSSLLVALKPQFHCLLP